MKLFGVLCFFLAGMFTALNEAAADARYAYCVGNVTQLAAQDVEDRELYSVISRMEDAAEEVLLETDYAVAVVVTDCPYSSVNDVAVINFPSQKLVGAIGMDPFLTVPHHIHNIIMTGRFMEDAVQSGRDSELVRLAIAGACLVRTGFFEAPEAMTAEDRNVEIDRCRRKIAEKMGDEQLSLQLKRTLPNE